MMKKIDKMQFAFSFLMVSVSVSYVTYCFGWEMQNHKCVRYADGATCANPSGGSLESFCGPESGDCTKCASDDTIPTLSCAPYEGARCTGGNTGGANCEDVAKESAPCEAHYYSPIDTEPSYYSCGTYRPDGTCDASNNVIGCTDWVD